VRDEIDQFESANVKPFGVNHAGVAAHDRYATKFGFPFPLLSDGKREAISAYGALRVDGKSIQRSVVLIDRDGTVRFARRGAPAPAVILEALA
jgi:peroxiredoxin Q/BCP